MGGPDDGYSRQETSIFVSVLGWTIALSFSIFSNCIAEVPRPHSAVAQWEWLS